MKSDRRSFLKFAAAAPVAAPMLVKSTAEALGGSMIGNAGSIGVPSGYAALNSTAPALPNDWLREEAKNLLKARKEALGNLNGFRDRDIRAQACAEVDALRSLSPSSRIRIAEDRIRRHDRDKHVSFLDERLKDIKSKLGLDIFGDIFNEIGGI